LNKPVVVLGAGGHASVLVDILRQLDTEILGLISKEKPDEKGIFQGITWYKNDEDVLNFDRSSVLLVNGIGSMPGNGTRYKIHTKFKQLGYYFYSVISPKAIVSRFTNFAEGVQIMPGCIVNTNVTVGESTILNSGSIVEHDCKIGNHNHIAPGAVLSGSVITEDFVHIGTGAQVIQGIRIGERSLVGAGATVTRDLVSNKTLYVAKPFLR
jgi:sugar O-acyltransferase (sialic acid O-acetyltransferase NeuD family)